VSNAMELYLPALSLRTAAGSLRSLAATIVERCRYNSPLGSGTLIRVNECVQ
jgi:hypothetical protein